MSRKKEKQENVSFIFPSALTSLKSVETPVEALEVLHSDAEMQDLRNAVRYRIRFQKQKYAYLSCSVKLCRSTFRYRLSREGIWELTHAECRHSHRLAQTQQTKFKLALEYLRTLPLLVSPMAMRHTVCTEFGLTDKQFYYILAKSRGGPKTVSEIINDLEKKGFDVYMSEEENRPAFRPPEMLLLTNERMKEEFKRYGDVVSFDYTFNLIKDTHPSGRKWKVGYFLGTSACKRVIPMAIVCALHENTASYCDVFRTFIKAMGGEPDVLVTDEEHAIRAAITELKAQGDFIGTHLLDAYHVLHNVRKRLKRKENVVLFSKALHARNSSEFDRWAQELRRQMAID